MNTCNRCFHPAEMPQRWNRQFTNGWKPEGISPGESLCEVCYVETAIIYDEERLIQIGKSLFEFTGEFDNLKKDFRCCPSIQTFEMFYSTLLNALDDTKWFRIGDNDRDKLAASEFIKIRPKLVARLDRHDCEASEFLLNFLFGLENNFPRI